MPCTALPESLPSNAIVCSSPASAAHATPSECTRGRRQSRSHLLPAEHRDWRVRANTALSLMHHVCVHRLARPSDSRRQPLSQIQHRAQSLRPACSARRVACRQRAACFQARLSHHVPLYTARGAAPAMLDEQGTFAAQPAGLINTAGPRASPTSGCAAHTQKGRACQTETRKCTGCSGTTFAAARP